MTDDEEFAAVLSIARRARVKVFVRGTDKHPVVECRDRLTGRVVGGSELKSRIQADESFLESILSPRLTFSEHEG